MDRVTGLQRAKDRAKCGLAETVRAENQRVARKFGVPGSCGVPETANVSDRDNFSQHSDTLIVRYVLDGCRRAASRRRSRWRTFPLSYLAGADGKQPAPAAIARTRNSPSEDLGFRFRVVLPILAVAGKVTIRLAPGVEGILQALDAGLNRGLLDVSLGQMFLEVEQVAV